MTAPGDLSIAVAGETLVLLPERGLYWPARRMLLVADVHFGKAAVFRARGVPVPGGTTRDNLARLDAMLHRYDCATLVCLGDLLHAAESQADVVLRALAEWRGRHAALRIVLIRGNHDRHAGALPASLAIEEVDAPWLQPPFALCHEPYEISGSYVLAGHVHPGFLLRGAGRDSLRMPCFCFDENAAVLPAFGDFTGIWLLERQIGRRIVLMEDKQLWLLPSLDVAETFLPSR